MLELGLTVSRCLSAGEGRGGLWDRGRLLWAEAAAGVEQWAVCVLGQSRKTLGCLVPVEPGTGRAWLDFFSQTLTLIDV